MGKEFLQNSSLEWDEMTVPLNLVPAQSDFLSYIILWTFSIQELGNKVPLILCHVLDEEVQAKVYLHDDLNLLLAIEFIGFEHGFSH